MALVRFDSRISSLVVLAVVCLLAIAPFFWRGSPSGHDFEFHMYSWMEVLSQWRQGIVYPRWAALAHWGYGEARFLFYPPGSWTLGAAIGSVFPWKMVPGVYVWIVLLLSGMTMLKLAREWLPPRDALFAAAFYAINPYHLVIVYWRSAYAELLAAALLPLLVLCVLRLDGRSFRPVINLGLLLAAAWMVNAPSAVMIHYSLAVLVLAKLLMERSWRPALHAAAAVVVGAGLASFYLVPAAYEEKWVNIAEVLSPGVRPQDNFLFTTIADPDHNRFNLMVSLVAIAEIVMAALAIWFARRRPDRNKWWSLLSIWVGITVLIMFSITNPLWQHLPKLRFVQLPWRWLLCLNAALAVLLTMAFRRWAARAAASAVLLAVVLTVAYRVQQPWWDTAADIREMSNAMADGTGYEGTDEYVPLGADSYELEKNARRVTAESTEPLKIKIEKWGPIEKQFSAESMAQQNLALRLFNYPAWKVRVNGDEVSPVSREVTGQMQVPIAAGANRVAVTFSRTPDRTIGGIVTLLSLVVLLSAWFTTRKTLARSNLGNPAG
jgi:hypothetical protein